MAWMHLVHTSVLVCSRSISLLWLAYLKRKTSCISQFLEHCIHIYTHMHIHIYSCTKKDTHAYGRTLIHTRICIHRYKHVQLQTDRQAQLQTQTLVHRGRATYTQTRIHEQTSTQINVNTVLCDQDSLEILNVHLVNVKQ